MLHEDPNLESEVRYDSNPKEAEDRKKKYVPIYFA